MSRIRLQKNLKKQAKPSIDAEIITNNLGIGQKGSMENDRVVKGLAKINSGDSKPSEAEKFDKEFNKSFTSIAISKGKAMANVGSEDSPYLKKNTSYNEKDK